MRKCRALLVVLLVVMMLAGGCGVKEDAFDSLEKQEIVSEAGYSLLLPADWQLVEEDDLGGLYLNADGKISLSLLQEVGGMEYSSLEEIGDTLCAEISADYAEAETVSREASPGTYSCALTGKDGVGGEFNHQVFIVAPYVSVRYYLVFTAAAADFRANHEIIDGICSSISIVKSEEDVYQWMKSVRAAAQDEEGAL